jgi:WD repeat-containing protein 42A
MLPTLLQRRQLYGHSPIKDPCLHTHSSWIFGLELSNILRGHRGCVNTLRWNSSGNLLVSGSDDRKIVIWSFKDNWAGKKAHSLTTLHRHNIFDAVFRPGYEGTIVSCAADGSICITSVDHPDSPQMIFESGDMFGATASKISFQPENSNVFLCSFADGFVRLFDLRARESHASAISLDSVGITAVEFAPHSPNIFAIGADDPIFRVCDIRSVNSSHFRRASPPSSENDCASIVRKYCSPQFLNPRLRRTRLSLRAGMASFGQEVGISGVAWSSDGSRILANYRGSDVVMFDMNPLSYNPQDSPHVTDVDVSCLIRSFEGRDNIQTCAKEVRWMLKDSCVVTGGDCGRVFIWNAQNGKLLRKMKADK